MWKTDKSTPGEIRARFDSDVEQEDSPRSLTFQLGLLRAAGFAQVEVLHKNGPFAAFGAVK
jgi:tRNA (cmo5U34)-methyltransferase